MTNHIGFIMDGNRRYSKKNQLGQEEGYTYGFRKFLEVIRWQIKYKLKETSFFALSNDNLEKRSDIELKILKKLLETFHKNDDVKTFFIENKIKLNLKGNFISKKSKLTKFGVLKLKKALEGWNEANKSHDFIVNIAINYDGHQEILHSFKEILKKIQNNELKESKITTKTIKENLWFNGSIPDIIVRTGDAPRLSGFMLWDSKYSELYLTKKLWPELDESDFIKIIDWFKNTKRNFGK